MLKISKRGRFLFFYINMRNKQYTENNRAKTATRFFFSASALLTGGILYVLFRNNTYISQFVERFVEINWLHEQLYTKKIGFLKYYLPDFLWAFALCFALIAIFDKKTFICAATSFVYGLLWEFLQYMDIIDGTGDIYDIIMYLTASVTAVMINKTL